MQVSLHTDAHTDGSQRMAEHLKLEVQQALVRFGERVVHVEAHLSDVSGVARSRADDIHCTLEARLIGLEPVVVKEFAGSAHQAIDGALHKLKRAVGKALSKHDPRSQKHAAVAPSAAGDGSAAAEPL